MPVSLVQSDSFLALEVGGATTRAALFDVVEGAYRFIAAGSAPSTAQAPFRDVMEGVYEAILALQSVTGRVFLDANRRLITPSQADGSGVDACVCLLSAGPALKTVLVGLTPEVSLESARRLAATTYARVIDSVGISDHRSIDQQIDDLIQLQPDLILVAGGVDGGATRSLRKMIEVVGLASYLLIPEKRPAVLFAGNEKLNNEVKDLLGNVTSALYLASNVRPSLDTEDLEPAAHELADLVLEIRRRQLKGVETLGTWTQGHVLPTAYAEGRMMRFLVRLYRGMRAGILRVSMGVSGAVIAAGFPQKTTLGVYPQFGIGENLPVLLQHTSPENILRWSPLDISPTVLRDYLFQKSLHPSSISVTKEELALAQAVTREALRLAMQAAQGDFPPAARAPRRGLLPLFEPILAGGAILIEAPTAGQTLLMLLDALQPVGVTTLILDRYNLFPLLGAVAQRHSLLPVQVLESGVFESLGTVVSAIASAHYGALLLRARLVYENGSEARTDVKFGNLELLPLPMGQTGRLTLQPQRGVDVGFGPGRGGTLSVSGGAMGVVIDGRGRPLVLPADSGRRREALKKWLWTVGG